jgi:hypothetical protein
VKAIESPDNVTIVIEIAVLLRLHRHIAIQVTKSGFAGDDHKQVLVVSAI